MNKNIIKAFFGSVLVLNVIMAFRWSIVHLDPSHLVPFMSILVLLGLQLAVGSWLIKTAVSSSKE